MPVIALINQKGGCGKSTNSCHIAHWLMKQGHSVAVIDSDSQQSVTRWLKNMGSPIQSFVMGDPDELVEKIPVIAEAHDFVVVDGAAGITETTRCILLRADLVIVPVQPSGLDLSSANDALRLVKQAQSVRNGLPKVKILISRAVKGTRLYEEAREFLKEKPLFSTTIHQRQAVADCFGQAAVVWTLPKSKGAQEGIEEFNALCSEIMEAV
jgi:chromosome partitioning protein